MKIGKPNGRQLVWAAVGVAVGVALFNNLSALAGNTVIGKVLNGGLIRPA